MRRPPLNRHPIKSLCTVIRETHPVPRRCNMILRDSPRKTVGGCLSTGAFWLSKSGDSNMKFDPCGGAAVMVERHSETLGLISFRLHQAQYDKRSQRAYV